MRNSIINFKKNQLSDTRIELKLSCMALNENWNAIFWLSSWAKNHFFIVRVELNINSLTFEWVYDTRCTQNSIFKRANSSSLVSDPRDETKFNFMEILLNQNSVFGRSSSLTIKFSDMQVEAKFNVQFFNFKVKFLSLKKMVN